MVCPTRLFLVVLSTPRSPYNVRLELLPYELFFTSTPLVVCPFVLVHLLDLESSNPLLEGVYRIFER